MYDTIYTYIKQLPFVQQCTAVVDGTSLARPLGLLTLISLMSERPCQVWGGGLQNPPPIYLGSRAKFSPKLMLAWKVASIPTHLTLFQNLFSITPQKISENWNSIEKSLKMSEISKICDFWAISTCNTWKNAFFTWNLISNKKSMICVKKYEKIKFFWFVFKVDTDQLSSIAIFSNL